MRVWQQHGVDGVARDRQLPVLRHETHARSLLRRTDRAAHGAGKPDELLRAAPRTDLQQLRVEHAPQRLGGHGALRGQQPRPRRRLEPLGQFGGIDRHGG